MRAFLQIVEIVKMALALYRRLGYEAAKSRLAEEIAERDDATTMAELGRVLGDR